MENLDYKEKWTDFYEKALEQGITDPGKQADEDTTNYYAGLADYYRDEMKYR